METKNQTQVVSVQYFAERREGRFPRRFFIPAALRAQSNVNVRVMAANLNGNTQSTGTTRFDMVTVSGTAFATATAASLTQLGFTNGQLTFTVNGSAGATYVVQSSTNLAVTNWLSVFTNVAPFTFSETNLPAPQTFYRAVSAP